MHGLMAIAPALVILFTAESVPAEMRYNMLWLLIFFAALTVVMFQAQGIYGDEIFSNLWHLRRMGTAWASAFCLLLFMYRALHLLPYLSLRQLGFWFFCSFLLFGIQRMLVLRMYRHWMRKGMYLQRTVIVGCTYGGVQLSESLLRSPDIRSELIGFIDERTADRVYKGFRTLPLLGNMQALEQLIRSESVNQVLIALPWSAAERIASIVRRLNQFPVEVLVVPDLGASRHVHRIVKIAGIPMLSASQLPLRGWSPMVKRAEDLVLAGLALLLTAPVMLLVAMAIKLDSPGPVFFKQRRYGYNNRLIGVYKFRSMYADQSDADAQRQTVRGDPRVTRVGHFIRRTSLDELPQLLNVLGGSMSMVGPRPHATATKAAGILFEEAVQSYASRHRVKPGITGWAQINGYRGETDTLHKIRRRVDYDLEYIAKWSVWFDLYILVRTLPALFSKEVY